MDGNITLMLEVENLLIRYALLQDGLDEFEVDGYIQASTTGARKNETDSVESRKAVLSRLRENIFSAKIDAVDDLLAAFKLVETGKDLVNLSQMVNTLSDAVGTQATSDFSARLALTRIKKMLVDIE